MGRGRTFWIVTGLGFALVLLLAVLAFRFRQPVLREVAQAASSHDAFLAWKAQTPQNAAGFATFSNFLAEHDVDGGHGAKASRHLAFSAVDLVPLRRWDGPALFERLCQLHREAGPRSGFGLGAYFNPARPLANPVLRFHVDATGYRSWGSDFHAGSSACLLLRRGPQR